jgi:hypothetical protein
MRLGRSDVLVAALVALWGQLDVWAPAVSHPYHMHGPRWANAVAFLAASLVLLWRRRAPLAVLVAVVLINGVHDVVVGSSESFPPLLALVVAAYTVAAWCDLRGALLGGGIAVAGLLVMEFTDPLFTHPADVLAAWQRGPWPPTAGGSSPGAHGGRHSSEHAGRRRRPLPHRLTAAG